MISIRKIKSRIIGILYRQLKAYELYSRTLNATLGAGSIVAADGSIENMRSAEQICIGQNSVIKGRLLTYRHGGNIRIGDWCYVGSRSEIWSMNSIHIGNRVLISHDVNIHDGTAHSLDPLERHEHYRRIMRDGHPNNPSEVPGVFSAPVVIEDDVWISFGVTILKGVRIGAGSVIAAGALVVKDVPPNSVYRSEVLPIVEPIHSASANR